MKPQCIYRHKATLDTDLYIHNIIQVNELFTLVRGSIFNRNNHIVYETEPYLIRSSELPKWKLIS